MKYYVLLRIQPSGQKQFIEIGISYELPFHPNLTDEIEVAGFPCVIKEIYYNLDGLSHITMRVQSVDCHLHITEDTTPKDVCNWLACEWKQIKQWVESNGERAILNDYSDNLTEFVHDNE